MTDLARASVFTVAERQSARIRVLARVLLFAAGATSGIQLANFTVTGLSLVCLLLAPGFLLMEHRGVDLLPIVLALVGSLSFLASCAVNDVSLLWPNATAFPAFLIFLAGLAVLTARSIDAIATVLAGIATGTVIFFLVQGIELTRTGSVPDLWKYGIAHAVTILLLFVMTTVRVHPLLQGTALGVLGLASLGLNFRSHALVCLVAGATVCTRHLLGSRVGRGWQFLGIGVFGLVFAHVMPIAARAGLFGAALQQKTQEQDATNLPLLLAGRTELPLNVTAILERPFLGWGSAFNLTPDLYTRAAHLAIRMGFDPGFPFDLYWRLPPSDYSATHSILLGAWVEGGVLAVLLPLWLLAACLGVVWNSDRFGPWAPLVVTVAFQGIWDLLYAPWTYNMIAEFACIALFYCAAHFRRSVAVAPDS
ncbi:hypothetical protein [Rhodococcus zopfii]|uniref:hypothetical protein n=1 Tax=Rhodococcus zopfii TaxID=43772 RepID=UPI001F107405|nr:hypothetical protein [Rhodococcus zopfii]